MSPKSIRVLLGSLAVGIWTVYGFWTLVRIGFVEAGNAFVLWLFLAAPVVLYVLVVKRKLTSILAGLVFVATRAWILSVLETSTSSTAGLVLIPALFIDGLAIGAGVIADQVVILLEGRRVTRGPSK